MSYSQLAVKRYLYFQTRSSEALGIKLTTHELNWWTLWKTGVPAVAFSLILSAMGNFCWQHAHDLTILMEALGPIFQFVLVYLKIGIYLKKHRHCVALVKRVYELSVQVTARELDILIKENSKDAYLSGLYYISIMTTLSFALLAPLAKAAFDYTRTGEYVLKPFFEGSYPFKENFRPPYCFFIYFGTALSVYLGAFVCLLVETLYSWFMHNIVAHFRILQQQLENFSENTNISELQSWIHYHKLTLALAEEFSIIYSPIIFVQFALNSMQIGLVGYQIIQKPPLADLLFQMVFLSAVTLQPTIYCYGGQRVEEESEAVALAIYENLDWQHWSIKSRKLMQLPIMRAQRSCQLNGYFFVANFRLYLWVIRTTASYMTLLWSMK